MLFRSLKGEENGAEKLTAWGITTVAMIENLRFMTRVIGEVVTRLEADPGVKISYVDLIESMKEQTRRYNEALDLLVDDPSDETIP